MMVERAAFILEGGHLGPIRGDVRRPVSAGDDAAIVVCHGFKGFKDWGFFPYVCRELAERLTRPVVSFNFSGSGIGEDPESFTELDRFERNTFSKEVRDLRTVLDAAASGDLPQLAAVEKFGLLGHSRGGVSAVVTAAEDERVAAVVTWSAVARLDRWDAETVEKWRREGRIEVLNARTGQMMPLGRELLEDIEENAERLDVRRAAKRLRVPYLIVHGTEDESVDVEEAEAVAQAAPEEWSRYQPIPGAGHTFGAVHPFQGTTEHLSQALDATVRWFRSALG